jgi:RimJ/RimL family protein N-acetyltransferase
LEWAWSLEGLERVRLFVDERNTRAERAYRKAGFLPTGHSAAVPGVPSVRDVELVMHRPRVGEEADRT